MCSSGGSPKACGRPGQALPSEPEIAADLGVSQGTVRKALDEMTAENLVVRRQGRGTYVASTTMRGSCSSSSSWCPSRRAQLSGQPVLAVRSARTANAAGMLGLKPREPPCCGSTAFGCSPDEPA